MALTFGSTADSAVYGVKGLIYGGPGVGKTRLAATAPGPIIISAEAGTLSLRREAIPMITVATPADLDQLYAWFLNAKEARQFATIYFDSLSEVAEKVLLSSKNTVKDPRQAYGAMQDAVIPMVKRYRDLPGYNVFFTAKLDRNKDEVSGMMINGPSMPGRQLGPQLPYLFDEVFRLAVATHEGKQYSYLQTRPDGQNDAKDRSGTLEAYERPDLSYIINRITGVA